MQHCLQECLRSIEIRYSDVARYGRSFYYNVFGLGKTPELELLAARGADAIQKCRPLHDHFLTSVDYVSHSLKAFTATNALQTLEKRQCRLDMLIPDEYCKYILHPQKRNYSELFAKSARGGGLPRQHPMRRTLCRADILSLTEKDLRTLHESDEYKAMAASLQSFTGETHSSETDHALAESALNSYLNRISRTLRPVYSRIRELITFTAHIKTDIAAIAAIVFISTHSDANASSVMAKGVEIFAKTRPETTDFYQSATDRNSLPSPVRLGSDIKLYL